MVGGRAQATGTGWRRWLALASCAFGLVAAVAVVTFDVLDRTRIHSVHDAQPIGAIMGVSFSVLGAVIVTRQPANRIGWLYLSIGILAPVQSLAVLYDMRSAIVGGLPGARWAVWLNNWVTFPLFPVGVALFAFLLFPDGRLPSSRWRVLGWLAVVLALTGSVLGALQPGRVFPGSRLPGVVNPLGVTALRSVASPVITTLWFTGTVLVAVVIGGLVIRGRRSADPVERQQIKLLAYAGAVTISLLLVLTVLAVARVPLGNGLWDMPIALGFGVAVPVACVVAILRHRLYEIDRLVSRTISYTLLTGVLVGTYAGLVALGTQVLPFSSPVAVAASTLAAAALFNPLRRRLQHAVDRRFNRARYDAEATVAAFAAQLRAAVDLDRVQQDLTAVVHTTLEPRYVALWLADRTPATVRSQPEPR